MRKLSELLELMLNNQQLFSRGLCFWALDMRGKNLITRDELILLGDYIDNNRPKWYVSFRTLFGYAYYWAPGDIKPRIKWLEKHIAKLKKEGK